MYDKLIFQNPFGSGDLYESRKFVKELMERIPAKEYLYAHGRVHRIFADIPELKFTKYENYMRATSAVIKRDDNLIISTWIGRNPKFVLPQVGCVLDKNVEMFNETLSLLGLNPLKEHMFEYIPNPDFRYFQIAYIDKFIRENSGKKKVLICNGNVQSGQAENFDFTPVILNLAKNNKDTLFIVTQQFKPDKENILYSQDIIKAQDGCELMELSYLAKFVDVIIGRKSGPFVFAHNRDVWMNSRQKSLSFTYASHSSHFVRQPMPLQKYWSSNTEKNAVIMDIERVLE